MAGVKLTKSAVAAAVPREKTFILFDSELPGFGLRVTPAGSKAWIAEYRAGGGGRRAPTRRLTIGSTSIFSADEARKAARNLLASVRLGADPAEDRKQNRVAATVAELSIEFLDPKTRVDRKASTTSLYGVYFRKHINPEIGHKRAQDVSHDDVVRLHRKIGEKQPATANRVLATLSGFFKWAIAKKKVRRSDNPARNIDLFKEKSRERFLSSAELARLGDALREAETNGLIYEIDENKPNAKHAPKPENRRRIVDAYAVAAIRLLLLTGARLREILHLRWSEVDLERGFLNLGESKTGQKSIVLNAPALLILSKLPRLGELVIASRSSGTDHESPRADLQRPWAAVTNEAGLAGLRIHDLRHTHASIGAGFGLGLPVIGKILGHRSPETTAKYAHLADDPLRRASDRIGSEIAAAMGDQRPGEEAVPFKRVRQ